MHHPHTRPPPPPPSLTLFTIPLKSSALVALLAAAATSAAAQADPATTAAFKVAQSLPYAADQTDTPAADAVAAIQKSIAAAAGLGDDAVAVTPGPAVLAPAPGTKVKGTGATSVDGLPCLPRSTCYSYGVDATFGDADAATAFKQRLAKGSVADLLPPDAGSSGVTVGKIAGQPGQARVVVLDEARAGLGGSARAVDGAADGADGAAAGGKKKLSKGALAGIVIGSILGGLLLLGLLGLLCTRCRRGGGGGSGAVGKAGGAGGGAGSSGAKAAAGVGSAAAAAGGAGVAAARTGAAAATTTAAATTDATAGAVKQASGRFGRTTSGSRDAEVV